MDSASETLEKIEDVLRCPVCLDMLKEPKFLPCGHTFCKVCLERCRLYRPSSIGMSCPLCKENSAVTSIRLIRDGPSDLPKNLIAQQVTEVMRNVQGFQNTEDANDAAFQALLPVMPAQERRRPWRFVQVFGRVCRWFRIPIFCLLAVLLFMSVLQEEHKQQLSSVASSICGHIAPKAPETKDWKSRITHLFDQISEELFGLEKEEEKIEEAWMEKVKERLKETSKRVCGAVELYRRRRQATYRRWMRAMDDNM